MKKSIFKVVMMLATRLFLVVLNQFDEPENP